MDEFDQSMNFSKVEENGNGFRQSQNEANFGNIEFAEIRHFPLERYSVRLTVKRIIESVT